VYFKIVLMASGAGLSASGDRVGRHSQDGGRSVDGAAISELSAERGEARIANIRKALEARDWVA